MNRTAERESAGPLAERLCAAYISAQMGFASIDYVIKKYIRPLGKPPSEVWFQIAEFVSEVMSHTKPLPDDEAAVAATNKSTATSPAPIPIQGRPRKRQAKLSPGPEK
jgi:hypothetical protein